MLRAIPGVAPVPMVDRESESPGMMKGINMKKSTVFCAALLGALAAPAYADGWRFVDGEAVWGYSGATRSDKTREPVQRERSDFERNPVATGGWKQVNGEAVWLYVGPQTERRASTSRASPPSSSAIR